MFSNSSILIVDDDPFARGIIKHHLNRLGVRYISEAGDGTQAIETLRTARMDLVIADRYMPKMNGLELFCHLQANLNTQDIPFIMITMEDCEIKIKDAQELGIKHYLVKPFGADMFDSKIKQVLLSTQENIA